ncbi:hypothetical protein I546_0095 [Mycobacterium kansasii 732]|nr:hypothetical protein I546_0095 [Mycobacterium kansasii 732]
MWCASTYPTAPLDNECADATEFGLAAAEPKHGERFGV